MERNRLFRGFSIREQTAGAREKGQAMSTPSNASDQEVQLRRGAATDSAFRQELLTDPRAAIERELGVSIPDGISIKALEETPGTVYIVVPPVASGELSDAELDAIAAGDDPYPNMGPHPSIGW